MSGAKYTYVPEWKRRNENLCYDSNEAIRRGMSYGNYIAWKDGRITKVVVPDSVKKKVYKK